VRVTTVVHAAARFYINSRVVHTSHPLLPPQCCIT
jgi:hypothetical protein